MKDFGITSMQKQRVVEAFGTALVLNILSHSGFEVFALHSSGVDLAAIGPDSRRYGIALKSRTRLANNEDEPIYIFRDRSKGASIEQGNKDRERFEKGCESYNLEPWIAICVELPTISYLYLTSLAHYDATYLKVGGQTVPVEKWRVDHEAQNIYRRDPNVIVRKSIWDPQQFPPLLTGGRLPTNLFA